MNINWDQLDGFESWSGTLDQILNEATESIRAESIDRRVAAQRLLRDFRRRSPNSFSRRLDEIAGDAIDDIFRATLEESLQSIANRSSALDGYIRDIQAVTQTANRQASLISLETPRTIAVGLTEVMGEIKSIKQAFEDNEESGEEITKRVDTITAGLKKLRDIMDDLT